MLQPISTNQKGISLYLIIVAMFIVLGFALTMTSLILIRFRSTQRLADAIVAFYIADSGIEEELYYIENLNGRGGNEGTMSDWTGFNVDATYSVSTKCRDGYSKCLELCPDCSVGLSCPAPRFCVKSQGSYKDAKRAIEIRY